jgi:hypothetical protein
MLYQLANIVSLCLKILGYHAGLVVGFPLAGVASDKLSRGACPNGAGREKSRLVFYLDFVVDPSGSGWHKQIKAGSKYHANNQEKES